MRNKVLKILAIFFILFTAVGILIARPGGGHGYSGGFSGGGGFSAGGGGADLFLALFYVLPPEVSVPLIIIVIIYFAVRQNHRKESQIKFVSQPSYLNTISQFSSVSQQISRLRGIDPNFSRVLFLDFVSSLYHKFYFYQKDKKQLSALNPFFRKTLLQEFINDPAKFEINEIVIGGLYIEKININDTDIKIFVRINSNMTITAQGKTGRYIIKERWVLRRDKEVLSPEPEKMHTVTCPACGAPADFTDSGYCKHCGTLVVPGKMQWYVDQRKVFEVIYQPSIALLTYTQEKGTNLPTIIDPLLENRITVFEKNHNIHWPQYFQKFKHSIVTQYFNEIYSAWSQLKWEKVRHLLSDRLWESYRFWINAYKENGLRNVLDVRITKIEMAKLEIDRYYEAITVRIFAQGLDYIVDRSGKVKAGNKRIPRKFSEYWTFIRRAGVEKDEFDIHTCPACGAPAENIGQAGICQYCGNKITYGDFSWVVAIITQDEEYKG